MRSSWPADRVLAVLAAVTLEGAWLTLAYVALQWLAGVSEQHLSIAHFAVAAGLGLLLARNLPDWRSRSYSADLIGVAALAGIIGTWLAVAPTVTMDSLALALARNPGGWLLGIAVLRGSAHAELDDEARVVERILELGVPGLVLFWVVGTLSGLADAREAASAAFGATLAFISAALLGLGLARLADLEVEVIDRAARRRWLVLLLGVSGLVLAIGVPLAALVGLPLGTALTGAAGPLAVVVIVLAVVVSAPFALLLDLLSRLGLRFGGHLGPLSTPGVSPTGTQAPGLPPPPPAAAPEAWVTWIAVAAGAVLLLLLLASLLRRPVPSSPLRTGAELREAEPIVVGGLPRLPRIHLRRPWTRAPRDAVEAYRHALGELAGGEQGRRRGETPREHAARVGQAEVGPSVRRLAADYQLAALAGRHLTAAEERRAIAHWRRVRRATR
jgi:Domain of unknown function (DUF4129)